MAFSILFVCVGNVCRSPSAELLLSSSVRGRAEACSAGLGALVGEGVDPATARALAGLGVDAGGHRARQFVPAMAGGADLILTAQREQRDRLLLEVPSILRRTFTLKEFVRCATRPASGRPVPAEVVADASRSRGSLGAVPLADDDIRDSYRACDGVVAAVTAEIADAVRTVVAVLGLDRPRPAR